MRSHIDKLNQQRLKTISKSNLGIKALVQRCQLSQIQILSIDNYSNGTLQKLIQAKKRSMSIPDVAIYRAKYKLAQVGVMVQNTQSILRQMILQQQQKKTMLNSSNQNQFFIGDVQPSFMNDFNSKNLQFTLIDELTHLDFETNSFHMFARQTRKQQITDISQDYNFSQSQQKLYLNFQLGSKTIANNPSLYSKFMIGQQINPNWLWQLLNSQMQRVNSNNKSLILKNTIYYFERIFSQDLPKDQQGQIFYLRKHFSKIQPVKLFDRIQVWGLLFLQFRAGRHSQILRTIDKFKSYQQIALFKSIYDQYKAIKNQTDLANLKIRVNSEILSKSDQVQDIFKNQLHYLLISQPLLLSTQFVKTTGQQYWLYLLCCKITQQKERDTSQLYFQQLQINIINLLRQGRAGICELLYVQLYKQALIKIQKQMGYEQYIHILIYLSQKGIIQRSIRPDIQKYLLGFFASEPQLSIPYLKYMTDNQSKQLLTKMIIDSALVGQIFDIQRKQLSLSQVRLFKQRLGYKKYQQLAISIAQLCTQKLRSLYFSMKLFYLTGQHQKALQSVIFHQLKQLQGQKGQTVEEQNRTNTFKDKLLQQFLGSEFLNRNTNLYKVTCFLIKGSQMAYYLNHPESFCNLDQFYPIQKNQRLLADIRNWLRGNNHHRFFFQFIKMALEHLKNQIEKTKQYIQIRKKKEIFRQARAYCHDLSAWMVDENDAKIRSYLKDIGQIFQFPL